VTKKGNLLSMESEKVRKVSLVFTGNSAYLGCYRIFRCTVTWYPEDNGLIIGGVVGTILIAMKNKQFVPK